MGYGGREEEEIEGLRGARLIGHAAEARRWLTLVLTALFTSTNTFTFQNIFKLVNLITTDLFLKKIYRGTEYFQFLSIALLFSQMRAHAVPPPYTEQKGFKCNTKLNYFNL